MLSASVVVPTYNRPAALDRTLRALCALDFPAELLQLVVVDTGDSAETEAIAGKHGATYSKHPDRGVSAARNHGARIASGALLMFVDDDIVVSEANLRQHEAIHATHARALVSGHWEFDPELRARLGRSPLGRYRLSYEDLYNKPDGVPENASGRVTPKSLSAANLSIRAETFWSLDGFDENFPVGAEDKDLSWRAARAGCDLIYDFEICVIHNDQHSDFLSLCRRQERGAIGTVYFARKNPDAPAVPMISANGPVDRADPPRTIARKLSRALLSQPFALALAQRVVRAVEALRPGGGWPLEYLYRAVGGLYVFRGVRRGLRLTAAGRWRPAHEAAMDRRIKVLHFISNSYPTGYFRLIAKHTNHDRFAMQVGSLDHRDGLQDGLEEIGIRTFAMNSEARWRWPLATLRLAWRLRRERVDVLHTHLLEASLVGLVAAKFARTRLAIFTGHHSHEVPHHNKRLLFEVDRFAARWLADVVISPSGEMRDTFVDYYGIPSERVEVIEHGIDLSRFDPETASGDKVRAELGLEGKLVFGAISKHFWIKNLDALVRAFSTFAKRDPDAHLIVLGIGDPSWLVALVDELRLGSRVSVLEPRRDIPDVLAAFDVFVHPALAESFGLAVVEAMAMRRPVVATPVGIAGDVIEEGVSGIRIPGTDVNAIVSAIERAVELRDRWPEIGAEARRRALEFTPERWVAAHERLYERRLGLTPGD